jgi:FMN phosphatase YigB (HAD superfamily)
MHDLAILFDVDNTLLDNDAIKESLDARLQAMLNAAGAAEFWRVYEQVRLDLDLVDIPVTIERYAQSHLDQPSIAAELRSLVFDFPFSEHVFAAVPAVLEHAQSMGLTAIVSDGDQVFQRHKIKRAGLESLVSGKVLVFVHKEREIALIRKQLPARHYVMVDDKPDILGLLRQSMGNELTTVFVRQGKYATVNANSFPEPHHTLESIADFIHLDRASLIGAF